MHDVGGLDGFGGVDLHDDGGPFHEVWERKACGMTMAFMATGMTNEAELRHAIERLSASEYVGQSYWERWVSGLATLLVEKDVATVSELTAGAGGDVPVGRPTVHDPLSPASDAAPHRVGDRVRVREWHPRGHTRCPAYAQGRHGTVVRVTGDFPLPDRAINGDSVPTEPVYCVRFATTDLWGEGGRADEFVHLDLWHTYLEALS
jgi:nitrile hydratase beta subunit